MIKWTLVVLLAAMCAAELAEHITDQPPPWLRACPFVLALACCLVAVLYLG